jgi:RimJ/RimL family protein N-acetyltransferase
VDLVSDGLTPLELLRAVLDPVRLSVLAASVREPVSVHDVADRLDVEPKDIAVAIGDLRSLQILDEHGVLNRDALAAVGRSLPREHPDRGEPVEGPWTESEAMILGRFFAGGRLIEIPVVASKRRLVMEKLALMFEPGERYAEHEVNFKIQLVHADYAAIRRYMVDEGFLDRADGVYWRTGGRYEAPVDAHHEPVVLPTSIDGVSLVEYSEDRTQQLVTAADDPRIHRYMSDLFPYPYEFEHATDWIDFCMAEIPPNNFLIDIDGVLCGGVGASPMSGEKAGVAEIGWWLNPGWWGRGIASAAAIALIDHLFGDREFMRLWAPVMLPNAASASVALNAGMVLEGTASSAYVKHGVRYDELDFGITREQWANLRTANESA